jgi:hypothetical protein
MTSDVRVVLENAEAGEPVRTVPASWCAADRDATGVLVGVELLYVAEDTGLDADAIQEFCEKADGQGVRLSYDRDADAIAVRFHDRRSQFQPKCRADYEVSAEGRLVRIDICP